MSGCYDVSLEIADAAMSVFNCGTSHFQINTQLLYSSRKKETFNRIAGIRRREKLTCYLSRIYKTSDL
jgi:hypothetical protein